MTTTTMPKRRPGTVPEPVMETAQRARSSVVRTFEKLIGVELKKRSEPKKRSHGTGVLGGPPQKK